MRELRFIKLWLSLGYALVAFIIFISLMPSPPAFSGFPGIDTLEHLLAYTIIMLWFGFIYLPGSAYRNLGLSLIMVGLILEIIQGESGYRTLEYFDMLANTLGVLFGRLLSKTSLSSVLVHVEGRMYIRSKNKKN